MTRRYSLDGDLNQLEQMTERLQDYLLGDSLSLPLAAGYSRRSTLPQLSAGAMLLRRRRLLCLGDELKPRQQRRLAAALQRHDAIQQEWTVHYGKKLQREVPARLKQMRPFFRDCQEEPEACRSAYPSEALRRAYVQEILLAMDEFGYDKRPLIADIDMCDRALSRLLKAGEFIWSAQLLSVYPRREFWWLYGSPA